MTKEWYQRNKEKVIAKAKKWAAENRERRKEISRRYCQNHPEKRAESIKSYQRKNWKKHCQWRKDNPQKARRIQRKHSLKRKYGLSPEAFEKMVLAQGGKCLICKERPATAIDHCHKTGKVRGILCGQCNCGLGLFKDLSAFLRAAADYIDQHV